VADSVAYSREAASLLRFSKDINLGSDIPLPSIDSVKDNLLSSALLISEHVTPVHEEAISQVCKKLKLPRDAITAFINSSAEINASSLSVDPNECVLTFTSGLINLLSVEEFAFVAGHELGHFLMQHYLNRSDDGDSMEHFMQKKYQEISADRIGYLAAKNDSVAMSAMIKTMSGLDSAHLRFDVGKFISQNSLKSKEDTGGDIWSTHPSMLIRCRALLWFGIQFSREDYPLASKNQELQVVDRNVESDFDKHVDNTSKEMIKTAIDDVFLWESVALIIRDNIFSKDEQTKFSNFFGNETLKQTKQFLGAYSSTSLVEIVSEKRTTAAAKLYQLIPKTCQSEISKVIDKASKEFCT